MRNKLLLIILLFPLSLFCQWNKITVSTAKNLNAIAFSSATSGIIVGDSGTILKTTNTGDSYTAVNSGSNKNLKDVKFMNSTSGIAIGNNGTILRTTNSGSAWTAISSPTANDLNAVAFTDANSGIIVGNNGTILKTNNGGALWTSITPITIYLLNKVVYINSSEIVACGGNGTIITSNDGGDNWSTVNANTTRYLTDIITENDSLVFVGDKGIVLKVNDALSAFEKDSLCVEQLKSISCMNDNCITVGKSGRIMAKENEKSWTAVSSGFPQNYNDIQFINDTTAIIVGDSAMVLKTITGGINNALKETPAFNIVVFPNPSHGLFYISLPDGIYDDLQLRIVNSLGNLISDQKITNSETLKKVSENIPTGIYLVTLSSEGTFWTQKIVIY